MGNTARPHFKKQNRDRGVVQAVDANVKPCIQVLVLPQKPNKQKTQNLRCYYKACPVMLTKNNRGE
jgi:hypothetical protein